MRKIIAALLSLSAGGLLAEVIDTVVDLAGASVSYTCLEGTGTISNSSDVMSVVTVDCASDCVFKGTIAGNIRLVKKGSGVLTIASENKGYTGGTYIEEGVLAAKSLSYLGAKGSSADMSPIVVIKNGATVRIVSGAGADSPLWMDQGIRVPEGDTGVLELDGWISVSGVMMMKNATLRIVGGGLRLGSWLDNFVPGATLEVSNSTIQVSSGAAFAGTVPGFNLVLKEGGILQMPPDGEELPNLVMAGGMIKRATLGGVRSGDIASGDAASPVCDFRLYGSLTVVPAESPSVIEAASIAVGRPEEKTYAISVQDGAELVLRGKVKPAAEDSGLYLAKLGAGTLCLDGHCEAVRFQVAAGRIKYTARTGFAPGCICDVADGVFVALSDSADVGMTMELDDGLLASADVWLDASRIAAADGEKVSAVGNRGSLGGSFYQAADTDSPTLAGAAINGKNALSFNGSQVLLYDGYTNKTSSLTTFVVMMPVKHVKWSSPFSLCAVDPANSGDESTVSGTFFYSFNDDSISKFNAGRGPVSGANAVGWAFEYELTGYSVSMPLMLHHRRNGSSGTAAAYYGSGHSPFTQTRTWGWTSQNIERLCVGGRLYANGNPTTWRHMNGYIGELLVFTRVLSDSEYAYVETYLRNKWFGENTVLPRVASAGKPRFFVEVEDGANAVLSPSSDTGITGGTLVKTGKGSLVAGDLTGVAKLEVESGELALKSAAIAGKAAVWLDPDDESTVTLEDGAVVEIANKGSLGGSFAKNLGVGATILSGEDGINGRSVLSFAKNGTLLYTGFVREDASKPRSLNVYAVVSRRSFTKFTSPYSFAHTSDNWFDKDANGNFHYEEHDANGGCYRTFYGRDARGFVNGLTTNPYTENSYFVDLPRRDADGEAYISVNRMSGDWQLTATVLASDELTAVPWYSTSGCRISPLNVNRVSLGGAMTQGGSGAGAGGYWDGRIGEFIVFESPLSVAEEVELLDYLRKKWFGKGSGTENPPACLSGSVKTSVTHDRLQLEVGAEARLLHALPNMPLASLVLDSASLVRTAASAELAETKLFSIADGLTVSGTPSLSMEPQPEADVELFSAGVIDDTANWRLEGSLSSRFIYEVDMLDSVCRLRKRRGMVLILR